jgi:hypothetical protein
MDRTPSRREAERERGGSRRSRKGAGREQERAEGSREVLAGEQSGGRRQALDHVGDPGSATFYLCRYVRCVPVPSPSNTSVGD